MFKSTGRVHLINSILLIVNIIYAVADDASVDEVFNLLWILIVAIYLLVPLLLYKRRYVLFFAGILITPLIGVVIMEIVIEGDAKLVDFLEVWTWAHELPMLIWPLLFTVLAKVAIDLTLKQNLLVSMEKERAQSEIKFLKSQLSPHVLFNNLNNIYSFALHKSKETPKLILKLSEIMRYMLYEAQKETVSLNQELAHVDDYVELQQIQLENRGELIYEKEGDFDNLHIAPLMLISFVENCFKHASATSIDDLKIIIQIEAIDNAVNIYLENSYHKKNEPDHEKELEEGGIGLANVQRRLDLLYPDQHTLIIKELKNRYIVNLSIQLAKS